MQVDVQIRDGANDIQLFRQGPTSDSAGGFGGYRTRRLTEGDNLHNRFSSATHPYLADPFRN